MSGRSTSFEIQYLRDKHWVIAEVKADEEQAKIFADNLLQKGDHEAVRVVRDFQRLDGMHAETVILEKAASDRHKVDLSLSPVGEAPVCQALADYYDLPARIMLGRMLRRYLDEMVLTPTELLHSAQELKRFGDKDRLLYSSVDSVSALQARVTGESAKQRQDVLYAAWEKVQARARGVAVGTLPADKTFAAIIDLLPKADGEEREFLCRALMSRLLLDSRSWLGKLDLLLAWVAESPDDEFVARMADGVVADIVVSAQVVQDLLGFQANLGTALCHMCDLVAGQAEPAKFAPASFVTLNQLFGAGRLPQASTVLLSRLSREVRGVNPLSRNEPRQEYEMFHRLMHRLVGHAGVVGGAASAEALVHRYAHLSNLSGAQVVLEAMRGIVSALSDGCRKVQFLLSLAAAPLASSVAGDLREALSGTIQEAPTIDAWVPVRLPPRDRMVALTANNQAILASAALPEEVRKELGNRVDEVLARYLVDEGVIEKIDKADDPLALRAIRLIKFCGSGVLIRGKSLDLARRRVIEHLRQPHFEEKFLASVPDSAQAEKYLRDFHRLLVEVGF
jgi:hypothetical protein